MDCIIHMNEVFEDQTNYRSGGHNCGSQSLENTPLLQFVSLFLVWQVCIVPEEGMQKPYLLYHNEVSMELGSLENLILSPKRAMGTEHSKTHQH